MSVLMDGPSAPAGQCVGEHPVRPVGPPCMVCGAPVKKAHGTYPDSKEFGPVRVQYGIRWRWFCSNTCSGRHRGDSSEMHARLVAASHVNKSNAERRTLNRLIDACRAVMDESGRVEVKVMVRVMMQEIRRERTNTASRRYIRKRRAEQRQGSIS